MLKRPGGALARQKAPTKSELLPGMFNWQRVFTKGRVVPAIAIILCFVGLFNLNEGNTANILNAGKVDYVWSLLGLCVSIASYYIFIYLMCGKAKPWLVLAASGAMTIWLMQGPVWSEIGHFFRDVLPGDLPEDRSQWRNLGFPVLFIKMFFAAGLAEELLKALPVIGLYLVGVCLPSPWRERIGVREPLDGILIGAASGVGFILFETLGEYVPRAFQDAAEAVGRQHGATAAGYAGLYSALATLIPRILQGLAGHMAWSAYFGYFIGLVALKGKSRWLILIVGYVTASVFHALWNSSHSFGIYSIWYQLGVSAISWIFLAAAILKARQLSPSRAENFATQVIGGGAAPQAHYSLQLSGNTVGLYFGTYLLESDVPGSKSHATNGLIGEVNSNPKDPTILGLKNLSNRTWTVTAAGRTNAVNPGQSTRLVTGSQIDFGASKAKIV